MRQPAAKPLSFDSLRMKVEESRNGTRFCNGDFVIAPFQKQNVQSLTGRPIQKTFHFLMIDRDNFPLRVRSEPKNLKIILILMDCL